MSYRRRFGSRRNPLLMVVPNKRKTKRNPAMGLAEMGSFPARAAAVREAVRIAKRDVSHVYVTWRSQRDVFVLTGLPIAGATEFTKVYPTGRTEEFDRRDTHRNPRVTPTPPVDPIGGRGSGRGTGKDKQPIDWIEGVLANDESSTDQELIRLFTSEGGLPLREARAWVAKRQQYLSGIVTLPDGRRLSFDAYMKARGAGRNPDGGAAELWQRSFSREFAARGLGGLKADFKEIFRRAETYRRRGVLPGEAARLIHAVLAAKPSAASRLPRYLPHPKANPYGDAAWYRAELAQASLERKAQERKRDAHHRTLERRWGKIAKARAGHNPKLYMVHVGPYEMATTSSRQKALATARKLRRAGERMVTVHSAAEGQRMKAIRGNPGSDRLDAAIRRVAALMTKKMPSADAIALASKETGVSWDEIWDVLMAKLKASKASKSHPGVNPGTDMGSIVQTPDFQKGLKLYRQIHGCDPKSIKRTIMRLGPNDNKVTGRVVLVSMGKAPADSYEPPKGSRKEGRIWVHPYDNKPEKVVTVDGKTIITMPGTHAVKAGPDGEAWIHG